MSEDPAQATDVLWVDEDEQYFVCPDCYTEWGGPADWTKLLEGWQAENEEVFQKLDETQRNCDLCQYDRFELAWNIRNGQREFEALPDFIKGDVFDCLVLMKETSVTLDDDADLTPIERHERQQERARELVCDELGLDVSPKSMSTKRIEKQEQIFEERLRDAKEEWEAFFEEFERGLDALVARGYGRLLADYQIAMRTNLWDLSQSGLLAELLGKFPALGFFQPFAEELFQDIRISQESAQNAERLFEEMEEFEENTGSLMRDPLESALEQSDKKLGRFYLLMLVFNHEALKNAVSDSRRFG